MGQVPFWKHRKTVGDKLNLSGIFLFSKQHLVTFVITIIHNSSLFFPKSFHCLAPSTTRILYEFNECFKTVTKTSHLITAICSPACYGRTSRSFHCGHVDSADGQAGPQRPEREICQTISDITDHFSYMHLTFCAVKQTPHNSIQGSDTGKTVIPPTLIFH